MERCQESGWIKAADAELSCQNLFTLFKAKVLRRLTRNRILRSEESQSQNPGGVTALRALVEEKPERETKRLEKGRGNLSEIKLNCFKK